MYFQFRDKLARLYRRMSLSRQARAFMGAVPGSFRTPGFAGAPLEDRAVLDIFTVAFNNAYMIGMQIGLLRKNLADPFCYTVIDNSTRAEERKAIEKICAQHNVAYLALPPNPFCEHPSASHGLALNWTYRNFIRPRAAHYWGCIDHDIFPVRNVQVIPGLDSAGVYGLLQERQDKWYLWPGFCFFSSRLTQHVELDFMPGDGLDTGGKNWETLFSGLDRQKVPRLLNQVIRVRGEGDDFQSDYFQLIGDWLHVINGSNWTNGSPKDGLIESTIRDLDVLPRRTWSERTQMYC